MSEEGAFIEALFKGAVVAFGAAATALGVISENAAERLPRQPRKRRRVTTITPIRTRAMPEATAEIITPSMEEWGRWLILRASLIDAFSTQTGKHPNMTLTSGRRVRIFAMPDFETAFQALQFAPTGTAEIRIGKIARFSVIGQNFSADVFGMEPSTIRSIS